MTKITRGVLLFLALLAGGVLSSCSLFNPEQTWSLIGTWVNPAYEQMHRLFREACLRSRRYLVRVQDRE